MNQTRVGQFDLSLRITGFTTLCLLLLLASPIFDLSPIVVIAGICGLALAILLPPAVPWILSQTREIDPFSPYIAFPIAYILWFVGGSINFIDAPSDLAFGFFDPIPAWMYGLYACGLAGYFCGLWASRLLPVSIAKPHQKELDVCKMQRILWFTVLGAVVSWAIMALVFGVTLLHPETANADRLVHRGTIYQVFIYLAWTAVIACPVFAWARVKTKPHDWILTAAVPFILCVLIVLMAAGRSPLVVPLVTLVIARSYLKHQPVWKLAATGALAFAAFSSLGYFRGMMSTTSAPEMSLMEYIGVPAPLAPVVDMSIDLRFSVAVLRDLTEIVPSSTPFQHGEITFLPLTAFFPGHQDMSDIVFKNMLGHDFEGAGEPATILGPLYVDFGWTGVFVGMSFYGALLSWTYRRMRSNPAPARIITYAWWLQNCLWGIFCNGFINVYVFLLPIFWMVLYSLAKPATTTPPAIATLELG